MRKKRQYGFIFIRTVYKILNEELAIDYSNLEDQELHLIKHIIEAIDASDLKK